MPFRLSLADLKFWGVKVVVLNILLLPFILTIIVSSVAILDTPVCYLLSTEDPNISGKTSGVFHLVDNEETSRTKSSAAHLQLPSGGPASSAVMQTGSATRRDHKWPSIRTSWKRNPNLVELEDKLLAMQQPESKTREPPLLIQFRLFNNGCAVKGTLLVNKKDLKCFLFSLISLHFKIKPI